MDLPFQIPRMMESTFNSIGRFGPGIVAFIAVVILIEAFYVVVLKRPGPILGVVASRWFNDGSGGRRR